MKLHLSRRRYSLLVCWLTLGVFVFDAGNVVCYRASASGEEWRPVEPAELALKTPTVEPEADAEAIFWDVRIDDGGQDDLVLSNYLRIKIFTERGRDQLSKIDIPYVSGTKIKDIAARTIKQDGSIVELAKDDVIDRTIVKAGDVKLKAKSFAFPGIEVGAIVEYKWKEVVSNSSANHMRLQFQRDIPVQSITYHIKPSSESFNPSLDVRPFNMTRPEFLKEKNKFYSTTVKNMRAFREEPLMPPEDSVRSWAMINYYSILSFVFGYPIQAVELYAGLKPFLKVDDEIKRKSAELIAGATTPEEKLEKILAFCRANIKNTNDETSGFTPEEIEKMKENKKPADTLKRGVGPAIDIDLLFAALANAAGFDARVALLPDRSKIFFDRNKLIPGSLRPRNIAVLIGEKWRFFDPGFPYFTPGMLRWQQEGVDALITDKSTPPWVKTPMSAPDKSKEKRVAKFRLDENGTLEGDVTIEYTGHLGVEKKQQNDRDSANQREENLKDAMKRRLSTAELTNIVIENVTDPTKPFIYKYHVRIPDYAQRTGKRLFLQPAFFQKGIGPLFTAATRQYPIYFHFPWSEEDKVTISLPKGYELDNADAPTPIGAGTISSYLVRIQVANDQSTIIYNRNFFFGGDDKILFPNEIYPGLKQLFDAVNKADNHTITLKQTGPAN